MPREWLEQQKGKNQRELNDKFPGPKMFANISTQNRNDKKYNKELKKYRNKLHNLIILPHL